MGIDRNFDTATIAGNESLHDYTAAAETGWALGAVPSAQPIQHLERDTLFKEDMTMTGSISNHAPSHLREQFQEWLDSYEPNRLHEIDIRPVAPLLDALADCTDVLPADYCDQLEIRKGSTYARAVEEVREFHAQQHGDDIAAKVEEFTFERRPLSDLPKDNLSQWLADFHGDDQWCSADAGGVTEAVVVLGDHIILWHDRPLTDEDKRSAVAEYRETETRHRLAEKSMRFLEAHGLTINRGWHLNGNPPSDVGEYLDSLIESCFPTDEAELTKQVIEMIEYDLPDC
jgi:hypothetical protein